MDITNRSGRNGSSPARTAEAPTVEGLFHRADDVSRAVEGLAAQSVPADEVEVYVLDASGHRARRVSVPDEPGTLKGAIVGALGGALLGLLVVVLAVLDVFGEAAVEPLGAVSLLGAARTIGASAAMGVPIGAVFGMGHWRGRNGLTESDFRGGGVTVVVHTAELRDTARRVLVAAGADRVDG